MVREGIRPRNLASTTETGSEVTGTMPTSNTFAAPAKSRGIHPAECIDEAPHNEVSGHTPISKTAPWRSWGSGYSCPQKKFGFLNLNPHCNVLVKGGDLPASLDAVDIFFDGKNLYELSSARINTRNTHGTGCTLASCIAAELAKGSPMFSAVKIAKHFVETALDYSKDIAIGGGLQGPFDHLLMLKNAPHRSLARCLFSPEKLLLYAVTDAGMNEKWGRSITGAIKATIEGGSTIVQLREKNSETREFLEAATACVAVCHSKGVRLLINDRVDIALACDADGVHIGQSDMPTSTARCLLGSEKIIGVSCQTPEQAHQAWIDGADYIGCGRVFPTNTNANNLIIGLDGLKSVCLASKLPVVAIGGINSSNACSVMEIGVPNLKGVAVVLALFDRECISTETARWGVCNMRAFSAHSGPNCSIHRMLSCFDSYSCSGAVTFSDHITP
ncbi:hypothetical protein Nepgr_023718 [Nepenthes gracilis]|uniref:thiamine phosphate synthase n=1 Tax=Nepenthes gracilis TaxID=150966 RepID=A0AAD3T1X2_NEPGR|nr:hypothetical protein Nepgr_023718 [Nepenthes gracilis]